MSDRWFYRVADRTVGPCSVAELRECVMRGDIHSDTPVRRADMTTWVRAARVKGLLVPSTTRSAPTLAHAAASAGCEAGHAGGAVAGADLMHAAADAVLSGVVGAHQEVRRRLHPQRYLLLAITVLAVATCVLLCWWYDGWIAWLVTCGALISLVPSLALFIGEPGRPLPAIIQLFFLQYKGSMLALWLLVLVALYAGSYVLAVADPYCQKIASVTSLSIETAKQAGGKVADVARKIERKLQEGIGARVRKLFRGRSADSTALESPTAADSKPAANQTAAEHWSSQTARDSSNLQSLADALDDAMIIPVIMLTEAFACSVVSLFGAFLEHRPRRRRVGPATD